MRRVGGHVDHRVHEGENHRDDDQRGQRADDLADFLHVQHSGGQHHARHQQRARPGGEAELLFQVGARAGEHHETNGEKGDRHGDIQEPRDDGVRDVAEHHAVLVGQEVAADLQDHATGEGHDDAGQHRAPDAVETEGNEVLDDFLAGGEARADGQSDEGHGDRECSLHAAETPSLKRH